MQSTTHTQSRWGRVAAQTISLLFHPLTMALWLAVLVMYGYASPLKFPFSLRYFVLGNVVICTLVIPYIFRLLLRLFGIVRRDGSAGRRVRVMCLIIWVLCYVCCGVIFAEVPLLFLLRKMLFLGAIVLLSALVAEFLAPLCWHTLSYGALMGYMWVLLFVGNVGLLYPFILFLVCGGLLMTARLYLSELPTRRIYCSLLLGVAIAILGAVFV